MEVKVFVPQSCLTLCYPMDCRLPGSTAHGTLQARILEWAAIPFARGSSQPRDQNQFSCTAGTFLTVWATRDALECLLCARHLIPCAISCTDNNPILVSQKTKLKQRHYLAHAEWLLHHLNSNTGIHLLSAYKVKSMGELDAHLGHSILKVRFLF